LIGFSSFHNIYFPIIGLKLLKTNKKSPPTPLGLVSFKSFSKNNFCFFYFKKKNF